uniref:Uncharacterized protein n=1 Tax=Anguilla anguilla TaxID=7936 RepID=A0A0E9SCX3_ANGAN
MPLQKINKCIFKVPFHIQIFFYEAFCTSISFRPTHKHLQERCYSVVEEVLKIYTHEKFAPAISGGWQ